MSIFNFKACDRGHEIIRNIFTSLFDQFAEELNQKFKPNNNITIQNNKMY